MTNGNDSIHNSEQGTQDGLTKREYFAVMAMQGFLSSGVYAGENSQYLSDIEGEVKPRCDDAVAWADALIESLNKNEKK